MKIFFYLVRHFSPNFHEFTGSKKIFDFFNPKIGEKKICQNPFQAIIRLKKKKKKRKVAWTTKPLV